MFNTPLITTRLNALLAALVLAAATALVAGSGGYALGHRLAKADGNAALAFRSLGHHERLVWLLPTQASATVTSVSPMPPLFTPLAVLAGGLVLALALWRGRRMGRIVVEPLPVVVTPAPAAKAVKPATKTVRKKPVRKKKAPACVCPPPARTGK